MYEKFLKRGIDIVLSFLGLVCLSWFYVIMIIAIKIDDPGPAFFTQKRSPDEIRSGYVQGENWVGYFYGKDLYKVNEEKEFLAVYNADLVYAGVDAGMNPEESKVYSKYFSDLQTYCEEKITGLILGTLSFDDWDKIVDNAKNQYHADEILAAKQSAYTRYKQQ